MRRRIHRILAATALGVALPTAAWAQGGPYVNFETIPTRALALSPDGTKLFATNVPDSRLEVFNVSATGGLTPAGSVTVGLDPIAVSARNNTEVWVVNLVSDSVSVVDVSGAQPRVTKTLLVGDEPRDVVFAGPGGNRAFITAARRGQNHPVDTANLTQTAGQPRADVWVFDATNTGARVGGQPLTIIPLFSDKPGSLAVSNDGGTVFATVATSGNETTTINDGAVCGINNMAGLSGGQFSDQGNGPCALTRVPGAMGPGGVPGPNRSLANPNTRNPRTGIIVKFNRQDGSWRDQANRDWRGAVPFSLPDNDVFAINANANPPAQTRAFQHVGTLNKSAVMHPTNGKVYVATIDAINTNRFLSVPRLNAFPNPMMTGGAARTADPVSGKTLNGHLYESRIAILSPDGGVVSRHLNKHINYEIVPSPAGVKERSTADPMGLVFSPNGDTLFVAALGTNQIIPFNTAQLDNDSFQPSATGRIQLTGMGGPTDMVVAGNNPNIMFVYKRFDNAIATVDVAARRETGVTALSSPEPAQVRNGRRFFYDAIAGSSNGEANCNVCHPAADKDDLAWDLGTPFFDNKPNPNNFVPPVGIGVLIGGGNNAQFNVAAGGLVGGGAAPMIPFNPFKGPMTVLTLRGIQNSGPMFWRGDAGVPANGMMNAPAAGADPLDERLAFSTNFNLVFEALLGKEGPLPANDFNTFTDWALSIIPPPNPHRPLNGTLNASQEAGRILFTGTTVTDVIFTCNNCHGLNPAMGFFGTRGEDVVEGETQFFKVTQLRTVYDKVGMFGHTFGDSGDARPRGGPRTNTGPQIRGTGTLHDGSAAGAEEFLTAAVFQLNATQLQNVVDFVYAFPSNLAPVVGQQVTLTSAGGADVNARIDLLQQRAATSFVIPGNQTVRECDLIAKAVVNGQPRGFLFQPNGGGGGAVVPPPAGQPPRPPAPAPTGNPLTDFLNALFAAIFGGVVPAPAPAPAPAPGPAPAGANFLADNGQTMSPAQVRALAQTAGQEVTFTCVYPGGGRRIGVDRNNDGRLDGMAN